VLQLGLGLGLGTRNGYFIRFFFFPYLKVTNTFVLPSWAEAWCKCYVMRFIRDCLHGSLPPCFLAMFTLIVDNYNNCCGFLQ